MISGIFKINIFWDFGNTCGDSPGFPTLRGYPQLSSGSSGQDCRFSVGVVVTLSSSDLIIFSLEAVKWVIHPMFFPFSKCLLPPESACFCSLPSAFRSPVFVFCLELIAAMGRRANGGRAYLVLLDPEFFCLFWESPAYLDLMKKAVWEIAFFENSPVQKCLYFVWLIVWLGMVSLTITSF